MSFTDGGTTSAHNTCVASFGFTPNVSKLTVGNILIEGENGVVSGAGSKITSAGPTGTDAGLPSTIGFDGTALNATKVYIQEGSGVGQKEILFGQATGGSQGVYSDAGLHYDAAGGAGSLGLLTVPNLTVSGTTTTIDSVNVNISDNLITLAYDEGQDNHVTDAMLAGSGVALGLSVSSTDHHAAAEAALPRLTYMGGQETSSPSKWAITRAEFTAAQGSVAATNIKHGVAVMTSETTFTGTATMAGSTTGEDVGLGAFKLCAAVGQGTTPELWIQVDA